MKKLFTLTFMMIMGCMMTFAQNVEFADEDGKTIANGSTYWATHVEDMDWCLELHSGVFIKNNGGSAANVELRVVLKSMTEGTMASCCAGGDCTPLMDGSDITKKVNVPANGLSSIETHWSYYPEDPIGETCEIELHLMAGGKDVSVITVMFSNDPNAAGIESVIAGNALCNVYDITGKLVKSNVNRNAVNAMHKGLYIVRELSGAKNVNKVIDK